MIDPVYRHARREGLVILAAWLVTTAYCCGYCYLHGYERPGFAPTAEDIRPILGIPSWFFWGVLAPWAACGVFILLFAGLGMADDDLGADHAEELERDIREESAGDD